MLRMNIRSTMCGKKHEWYSNGFSDSTMCGLARKLKTAGFEDQPYEVWRGDMKCLIARSLHWAAGQVLTESDKRGLGYRRYAPMPNSIVRQ